MAIPAAEYKENGKLWEYHPPGVRYWVAPGALTQEEAQAHYEANAVEQYGVKEVADPPKKAKPVDTPPVES